jgi:hypothetical protein
MSVGIRSRQRFRSETLLLNEGRITVKITDETQMSNHSMHPSDTTRASGSGFVLTGFIRTMTAALLCGLAVSLLSISLLSLLSGDSIAQAQANPRQSSTDHSGWVQIPGELIRPDCVHEIPNGATVSVNDDDDQITADVTLNGALIAHYDACPEEAIVTRPHARTDGFARTPFASTPGTGNGWVEADQWNVPLQANDDIDYLAGSWTVPPYPAENGALIYLFNGVEPSGGSWILQPVLQYGVSPAGGGDYWAVASWLVSANQAFHSPLETVYPGNSIKGYMEMTGVSGNTKSWDVETKNATTGASSYLSAEVSGQHWTWAYAGVLEAYNVTSCAQFPSNGREVFKGSVVDHGFPAYIPPSPRGWNGTIYPYGGPSCHFAVVAAGGTLDF